MPVLEEAGNHGGYTMKVLYISGPFGNIPDGYDLDHGIRHNINEASRYALMAARKGWAPFTPHKNTADFQHVRDLQYPFWMEVCLEFLERSDAILMIPGWERSGGAVRELERAAKVGIPIYFYEKGGIPPAPVLK